MAKRFLDIIASLLGLFLLFPAFLVVCILVKLKLGSPIFFTQERPGLNSKVFKLIKFRTMLDSTGSNGDLLSDEARLISFGRFLRATSLDELPGLLNVLKGNMSLVGPRPLLVKYLPLYSQEQARRHNVRPGITGWAQVNGRNAISWEDKFKYDIWYVENCSMILDLKILLLTVKKVLVRDGISAGNHATMPEFKGNSNEK